MVYRVYFLNDAMKRLFIIDDDEDILFSFKLWFEKKGFAVETFTLPEPMIHGLESTTPGLILMDVNLEDKDGIEICKQVKQNHQFNCSILLFSANPFVLKDYKVYLADGAIEKPFGLQDITTIVTSFTQAG